MIEKYLSAFVAPEYLHGIDVLVSGLCDDSRAVKENELFVACKGENVDAREYIDNAIEAGAAAVLVEQGDKWQQTELYRKTPLIVVENLAEKITGIAQSFYNFPADNLQLVGITGTNAKTSCASYLQQSFACLNKQAGVIGTLGWSANDALISTANTTPNSLALQKILAHFVQQQLAYAVMEVSSHGLVLGRTKNLPFKVAVFTNLSRDHLDFHGDMQSYAQAKQLLFKTPDLKLAVINLDDAYAQEFIDAVDENVRVITFGASKQADVCLQNLSSSLNGLQMELLVDGGEYSLHANLLGDFNAHNLMAVVAVLIGLDFSVNDVLAAVSEVKAVKGRMESFTADVNVIVDYSHTPDGLEKALQSLQQFNLPELWCVFGCGGDRDQGKRALMGKVASEYADHVIVTNDNPRSENPEKITQDILQGCDANKENIVVELDRAKAIRHAVANAQKGACVLVAGKGHETYQEINGQCSHFSDQEHVQAALQARLAS